MYKMRAEFSFTNIRNSRILNSIYSTVGNYETTSFFSLFLKCFKFYNIELKFFVIIARKQKKSVSNEPKLKPKSIL